MKTLHSTSTLIAVIAMVASTLGSSSIGTSARSGGSPGRSTLLVSPDWLGSHLNDRGLVLIHVGQREDYEAGHIAGAHLLTLRDISTPPGSGLRLELPPVDELKSTLQTIGISSGSRIVVYFVKDWVTPAARVYFTLDFLGLGDRTSILDGGLQAWQADGHPTTAAAATNERGSLTPQPRRSAVVDADWVSSNLNNRSVSIIDARLPEYYSGASAGGMKRAGHIPGAANIPFSSLVDEKNKLKSPEALRKIFEDAGIKSGNHIVAYCHIGQQASLVYFVARYLGFEPSLYDGSFEDWSARPDLPVATDKR
ncbi:MAG TPA: sulfurtransferase [Acidobacteriota bacterium]|nr:sulfurtransferase [Acidobacteriota bacterium]